MVLPFLENTQNLFPAIPELQHTVDQLFSILEKEEGIGLAAPQIGLSKRIFIIDTTPLKIDDPSVEIIRKVFINPVIKEYSRRKRTSTRVA